MTNKNKTLSLVEQATALLTGSNVTEQVVTGGGQMGQAKGPVPVAAAGGGAHSKRPQDKEGGQLTADKGQNPAGIAIEVTPTENNVQATSDNSARNRASVAMKPVREDIDAMFAGSDVSEEFKTKATTIFEAAVGARVTAIQEELEAQTAEQLEEAVAQLQEELATKIDEYLQYVTEQWLTENEVAVESGLRADISESFMQGLHQLFVEHHIEVPEDKLAIVEAMAGEISELEQKLNVAVNKNVELEKTLDTTVRTKIEDEVTEGLVETQKAKLKTLFETVEFTTVEEFTTKLKTIKEGYTAGGAVTTKTQSVQNLLEQVEEQDPAAVKPVAVDPSVKPYVDALSRTLAAR